MLKNHVLFSGTIIVGLRARFDDVFLQFDFLFVIQFASDWSKANNQASSSREIQKHQIQREVFLDSFVRFFCSIWIIYPTRRGMFHETEANHANLCPVVDCFKSEIHQSRETGPPERPQREARCPLARSRPPTAPQKKVKAVQNPVFHPSMPPKPYELRSEVRSLYPRRCCPRGALGWSQPTREIARVIVS